MANKYTNITKLIKLAPTGDETYPNLDFFYGPYNSIEEACEQVKEIDRALGRTVGIIQNGTIFEYWWKSGLKDKDLVKKIETNTLNIEYEEENINLSIQENESIHIRFKILGQAGIKSGIIYQVFGNIENQVKVIDKSLLFKNSNIDITINAPSISGTYTYRLRIIDNNDNLAIVNNNEDQNYLDYIVKYGNVSVTQNYTQLNYIKIKNPSTLENQYFSLNIQTRDEDIHIEDIQLYCSTHQQSLDPYTTHIMDNAHKDTSDNKYNGLKYYYLPSKSVLENFKNKECKIAIIYKDGTQQEDPQYINFFKILDETDVNIINVSGENNYYKGIPSEDKCILRLETGNDSYSAIIKPNRNSDFEFSEFTVIPYQNFTLPITGKNSKENALLIIDCIFMGITKQLTVNVGNIYELSESQIYGNNESTDFPSSDAKYIHTIKKDIFISDINNRNYIISDKGQYVTIVNNINKSFDKIEKSFLFDIYCLINQEHSKDTLISITTSSNHTLLTIDENNIKVGNINTDTPLNEWTQISIGHQISENGVIYNAIYVNGMVVKSSLPLESDAIIDYGRTDKLIINIKSGLHINQCTLYVKEYDETNTNKYIYPNTTGNQSIVYHNYVNSYDTTYVGKHSNNLPLLKLKRLSDEESETIRQSLGKGTKAKHCTKFGTIGTTKYNRIEDYAQNPSLLAQHVDIKKPAQKEYAVFCKGFYSTTTSFDDPINGGFDGDGNLLKNVIIETHTQGTSTLVYDIPNFKFTFWIWNEGSNKYIKYEPSLIPIIGLENSYYQESTYTAKADYMDSSHLNNTPTCGYFNNLVQKLINDENFYGYSPDNSNKRFEGSPSAKVNGLDAIMGLPVIIEVDDTLNDDYVNMGSFMLNIDKSGDSLKFQCNINNHEYSCISFEGTSNDNETGGAGRFEFGTSSDLTIEEQTWNVIFDEDGKWTGIDKTAITNHFNNNKNTFANDDPYIKWCRFFSKGFEYRYPDTDIYSENDDKTVKSYMALDHFLKLYEAWTFVNNSDNLDNATYKNLFNRYFDVNYCILYFIQLMTYAQTDNLGKNAMFDCWSVDGSFENSKIYPRPYDLDSEAGLDNNGNDNIAPFVEIISNFSLNKNATYAYSLLELCRNYLIDHNIYIDEFNELLGTHYSLDNIKTYVYNNKTNDPVLNPFKNEKWFHSSFFDTLNTDNRIIIPVSQIEYTGLKYDRYHYSSSTSKLWINFYKNFKKDITTFYNKLRTQENYGPESIIEYCKENIIEKLDINQYNQDFKNKYLGSLSYQVFALGNRWYKFKKWITNRFAFCDSYFFNPDNIFTYGISGKIDTYITVDTPQYISVTYQGGEVYQDTGETDTKFVIEQENFKTGSDGATKFTLSVNQPSVITADFFNKSEPEGNKQANYCNLIKLDLSGTISPMSKYIGDTYNKLIYLNISNSNIQVLNVPKSLKTLVAKNLKNTLNLTFENGSSIESIDLTGTNLSDVSFSNLSQLNELIINGCTFNNVTFEYLPKLSNINFNNNRFNKLQIGNNIKVNSLNLSNMDIDELEFSGSTDSTSIKELNFYGTKFNRTQKININAIADNLESINLQNSSGLEFLEITNDQQLLNLSKLSLENSHIKALGTNPDVFDCQFIPDMGSLVNPNTNNPFVFGFESKSGSYSTYLPNNIPNYITKIINLKYTGLGTGLFNKCHLLDTIHIDQLHITSNGTSLNLNYIFYGCECLKDIQNRQNISVEHIDNDNNSAQYLLSHNRLLPLAQVLDIFDKLEDIKIFNRALYCKQFISTDKTIDITRLFRNSHPTQIDYLLSNFTDVSFDAYFKPNNNKKTVTYGTYTWDYPCNKLKIEGQIPNSVTSCIMMLSSFRGNPKYKYDNNGNAIINASGKNETESKQLLQTFEVNYNIIADNTSIQYLNGMFADSTVTFVKNNNTTTKLVDEDFFNEDNNIISINTLFQSTDIEPKISDQTTKFFNRLTKLQTCEATFYYPSIKSFTNGSLGLQVDNIWKENPELTSVAGCFVNRDNVYIQDHLNLDSNINKLNISGLFGLTGSTNKPTYVINWNVNDNIVFISHTYFLLYNRSSVTVSKSDIGTFRNRKVKLSSLDLSKFGDDQISNNLIDNSLRHMFNNAVIEYDGEDDTIILNNFVTDCTYTFAYCTIRSGSLDKQKRVQLPQYCEKYDYMFAYSRFLETLPEIRSSKSTSFVGMYDSKNATNTTSNYGKCVIGTSGLYGCSLPSNYFSICKQSVQDTSFMFHNNLYLNEIKYDANNGLFDGCVNLKDVTSMFEGTYFLHDGIPNNLFGSTQLTNLISLKNMFASSSVLYKSKDTAIIDNNKILTTSTFSPLNNNLQSIEGLFKKVYKRNTSQNDILQYLDNNIDLFNLNELLTIDKMFMSTPISSINYRYNKKVLNANSLYCDCKLLNNFGFDESNTVFNLNQIKNLNGTFALLTPETNQINKLNKFIEEINKKSINSQSIVYNRSDSYITNANVNQKANTYVTDSTEYQSYIGHNLVDTDPLNRYIQLQ